MSKVKGSHYRGGLTVSSSLDNTLIDVLRAAEIRQMAQSRKDGV
jgi:hypothetical protein